MTATTLLQDQLAHRDALLKSLQEQTGQLQRQYQQVADEVGGAGRAWLMECG